MWGFFGEPLESPLFRPAVDVMFVERHTDGEIKGQHSLCVASEETHLEIEFGNIKQSFAAGVKALVLCTDPMVFECFFHHLLQHLRTETHICIHIKKTLNQVGPKPSDTKPVQKN